MVEGMAVSARRTGVGPQQRTLVASNLFDLAAIAGLGLGTLVLGLYRSNSTSLWTDELFSITLASKPLPVLLRQLWSENANMSLYYLALGGWLHFIERLGIAHP